MLRSRAAYFSRWRFCLRAAVAWLLLAGAGSVGCSQGLVGFVNTPSTLIG
jgi:hypothetical protein